MLTNGEIRFTGEVCVIGVTGKRPEERSVVSQPCKGRDTKSVVNVNFVAIKHRNPVS